MDWQELSALFIVAFTVVVFVSAAIRQRARSKGSSVCGCETTPDTKPPTTVLRGKKGGRAALVVKLK